MLEKIKLFGDQEIAVTFNGAAMIKFEEIVGHSFFEEKFDRQESRTALIYASIYGADEKTEIDMKKLSTDASWNELTQAFAVTMAVCSEWFDIPQVMNDAEGEETKEGEQAKN